MTSLPTLYGKTKVGKIKVWTVTVEAFEDGTAAYNMISGLEDGKKTTSVRQVNVGKNIGKANETTPFEQALSEAQSRWNKQVDKGYRASKADLKDAHEVEFFLPMLAERYDQRAKYINFPAYIQPKLDGFRCIARKRDGKVTLWSRKGKVFDTPVELIAELEATMQDEDCYDGELYVHEWRNPIGDVDFQRIASAIKKYNEDTPLLEYHVYDRPVPGVSFLDRFINNPPTETQRIKVVSTTFASDEKAMMDAYDGWITQALPYEGLMVRNFMQAYLYAHRSNGLQKVKPMDDAEFEIIGGQEATGEDAGTVVFKCVAENGEEFDVRPKGTREQRAEWWDNLDDYIGQWLTVEFNGRANSGKPRFPRGTKIRPEWDVDLSEKKSVVTPAKAKTKNVATKKNSKVIGGISLGSLFKGEINGKIC
jgi:DNA ligase-1